MGRKSTPAQSAHYAEALSQMSSAHIAAPHSESPPYSTAAVPPTTVFMHQTIVKPPKGVSGLGIASLVLGIVAAIFCWVPLLGLLVVPIVAIGILLGCFGFLISLLGRRSSVGMPVAGLLVCATALTVAFVTNNHLAKWLREYAAAHTETNQQRIRGIASNETSTLPPADGWVSAENGVRQGDIDVEIVSARVGRVPLSNQLADGPSLSKGSQFIITLRITNNSSERKVDYRTWAGSDLPLGDRDFATAEDNIGNLYKRITFGPTTTIVGNVGHDSVYPGKSLTDVLVFEPPVANAAYVNLELPARNFGGSGMLRLRIPSAMIKGRVVPFSPTVLTDKQKSAIIDAPTFSALRKALMDGYPYIKDVIWQPPITNNDPSTVTLRFANASSDDLPAKQDQLACYCKDILPVLVQAGSPWGRVIAENGTSLELIRARLVEIDWSHVDFDKLASISNGAHRGN